MTLAVLWGVPEEPDPLQTCRVNVDRYTNGLEAKKLGLWLLWPGLRATSP